MSRVRIWSKAPSSAPAAARAEEEEDYLRAARLWAAAAKEAWAQFNEKLSREYESQSYLCRRKAHLGR